MAVISDRGTLLIQKGAHTKSREVVKCFEKCSVLKVAGILSHAKFQNKKSRGFTIAQKVKTKGRGNLMSRILYTRLYDFFNFIQIFATFSAIFESRAIFLPLK